MAELLKGYTLSEKHRFYNKLLAEAIANKETFEPTLTEDDDIRNLMKIDLASANRNIDFILQVLKCEDILYISRAITRSSWLITEQRYEHIITPEYLHEELFPHMTTTAIYMLMSSIRRHLKQERRVEEFYNYLHKKNCKPPFKWLYNCSIAFIETEVRRHINILPWYILPRLFEKSLIILEAALTSTYDSSNIFKMTRFIKVDNIETFLDTIEKVRESDTGFHFSFTAKRTARLMKECPDRILNKFVLYYEAVNMPTFLQYLKKRTDRNEFLLKQVKNYKMVYSKNNIIELLKLIGKENFEFIKKYIIDHIPFVRNGREKKKPTVLQKIETFNSIEEELVYHYAKKIHQHRYNLKDPWLWYSFAPFDIASEILMKTIPNKSFYQRFHMLDSLLCIAGKNMESIRISFKYCYELMYEGFLDYDYDEKMIDLFNKFFLRVPAHLIDNETWNLINQLLQKIEETFNTHLYERVKPCVEAILIRNVILGKNIPENIQFKFKFDTLASYKQKILNKNDSDALFSYLYNLVNKHLEHNELLTETDFSQCVTSVHQLINLLKDWKKDVKQYPGVLNKIKELIQLKSKYNLNEDLSFVFNIHTCLRKTLLNDYVTVFSNNVLTMNVLKQDPDLLIRCKNNNFTYYFRYCKSLGEQRRVLNNIRIYWPDSVSKELKTYCLNELTYYYKDDIIVLMTLLTRSELKVFVEKYNDVPVVEEWIYHNDERYAPFKRQQYIAETMYMARPLIHVDLILPYAIGDFIKYSSRSVTTILYQLSTSKAQEWVIKLLDGPISWQKIGIRYALLKLSTEHSKSVFSDFWNHSKNSSVRTFLITWCHTLMCKETNELKIKKIWEVISMFIDNLSTEEDTKIYEKLTDIENVPLCIKSQYFIKIYSFLRSLPDKSNIGALVSKIEQGVINNETWMGNILHDDIVVDDVLKNLFERIKEDKM